MGRARSGAARRGFRTDPTQTILGASFMKSIPGHFGGSILRRKLVAVLFGLILAQAGAGSQARATEVIFVSNPANLRIDKFAMDGSPLDSIDVPNYGPYGLAVNSQGTLYVSNLNNQIVRFDRAGNALDPSPTSPFISTGLSSPYFLAVDSSDRIYAANYGGNSVSVYNNSGGSVRTITSNLSQPYGIAFDSSGNLYVANFGSNKVTSYDSNGIYRTGFDIDLPIGKNPIGLAVGPSGRVYVANYYASEVTMYDWNGSAWSQSGLIDADHGLSTPKTIVTSADGDLYAVNQANSTLTKYTPAGVWQDSFAPYGLTGPFGVAIGVPEPSTYAMAAAAASVLVAARLRRRRLERIVSR